MTDSLRCYRLANTTEANPDESESDGFVWFSHKKPTTLFYADSDLLSDSSDFGYVVMACDEPTLTDINLDWPEFD